MQKPKQGGKTASKPKTEVKTGAIEAFIKKSPAAAQPKMREMHALLRKAAPGATESIKWGNPAFSYKRILFIFGGFKSHIGFYPTPSAMKAFAKELSKFEVGAGSVQFPLDKPLPKTLITKIAKFRVKESLEKDGKWM